jgi:hypothetical protein
MHLSQILQLDTGVTRSTPVAFPTAYEVPSMNVVVSESEPLTFVLAGIAMLGTLVLAWRAYRHSSREDYQRKIAIRRRLGR